jgi:hypothetical protein
MSNGYLIAVGADVAAAHEISDGFGLDVIDAASIGDPSTAASGLGAAANVGLLISSASADDAHYVAILRALVQGLQRAQLILVDANARAALPFLPEAWPALSLDDARARAAELVRRRDETTGEPQHATPIPPALEPAPEAQTSVSESEPEAPAPQDQSDSAPDGPATESDQQQEHAAEPTQSEVTPEPPPETQQAEPSREEATVSAGDAPPHQGDAARGEDDSISAPEEEAPIPAAPPRVQPAPAHPPAHDLGAPNEGPSSFGGAAGVPTAPAPSAPPQAPAPASVAPPPKTRGRTDFGSAGSGLGTAESTAPADATAFAPKKIRRGTPELVQVTIHQPKDLKAVIKAAKKANPGTAPAPQGVHIGDIALGASIGVALETRGVSCDGTMQRRPWRGEPIDFSFSVEADEDSKKALFIARVFIDDAQIGTIGFVRPISGPAKKAASAGDGARLKRHKRVFLSYSSHDRETVSAIATAYQAAGVPHFWDRASLKSGEIWSPRLRKEIDRADLFHLCWSKSAASSEWVEKETEHALTRRKRSNGKNPDITVQMLDGPPWAPHPRQLDAINFDDFVRAAIVGYARGDGST